jgi:hypothetical protein
MMITTSSHDAVSKRNARKRTRLDCQGSNSNNNVHNNNKTNNNNNSLDHDSHTSELWTSLC